MKIVHISTYDISGGAARAAYRLHKGLRELEQDSCMVVRRKQSTDPDVVEVVPSGPGKEDEKELFCCAAVQERYINANRTELTNTIFSLPYPGYDLTNLRPIAEADIINLHWVAYYQSPLTLAAIAKTGKPIVWTLHDQWAFTAGCHYSATCRGYEEDCSGCPQLLTDRAGLTKAILEDKKALLSDRPITIVSPSRWLADCVRASSLFGRMQIEVIPNGVEPDIFKPMSRVRAKGTLGLAPDTLTILFGAEFGTEKRKGFGQMIEAVRLCRSERWFDKLVGEDRVRVLCFGEPGENIDGLEVPVVSLGYLKSDGKIRQAYNAADVFIQASLEDNLPNTVLEAMSCGTAVIGFDVGGIPDMIRDGIDGRLVPKGDTAKLAGALLELLSSPSRLKEMGRSCRLRIEKNLTIRHQAVKYADLYSRIGPKKADKFGMAAGSKKKKNLDGFIPFVNLSAQTGPSAAEAFNTALLLTLKDMAPELKRDLDISNADRAQRLRLIEKQGKEIERLQGEADRWLKECEVLWGKVNEGEGERNRLRAELEEVKGRLAESEADREARLEAIEKQGKEIERLQGEADRWLKECEVLWGKVNEGEGERNRLRAELEEVKGRLAESEADREARLKVIMKQGDEIVTLQADLHKWLKQCEELWGRTNSLQNSVREAELAMARIIEERNALEKRLLLIKGSSGYKWMRRFGMVKDSVNE